MGSVYEAVHKDLKKRVAIKTLLPALAATPDARTRFLREGEAASRIQHPHVVNVTDVGAEGKIIYLVMEYLEGEDVAKLIATQGALPVGQTADIMLPVAAAIHSAHEQGVVHRDLKPENIFLARSAVGGTSPKVLDFGISKVTSDRNTMVLTGTGATFGTTFYLPPEQLQGAKQADAKSDQYALGTILYECVTGERAFESDNLYAVLKNIAEGRYVPPRVRRPDLPSAMADIISRAMSLDPAARFQSVRHLGAALLPFASPNARMLWTPFFDDVGFEIEDVASGGPAVSGGTMVLPAEAAEAARLAATPAPPGGRGPAGRRPRISTTFGSATGESRMPGPIPDLRKSRAPFYIGLLALAGVGTAAVMLWPHAQSTLAKRHPPTTDLTVTVDDTRPAVTRPPEPRTFRVEIETEPRAATLELDGRPVGSGSLDQRLPVDGTEHVLVARSPGYKDTTVRFSDHPPAHLLALDTIPVVVPPKPDPNANATNNNADRGAAPIDRDRDRGRDRDRFRKGGRKRHGMSASNDNAGDNRQNRQPPKTGKTGGGAPGLMPNGAPIIE
jgi:hypothetical protein